MKKLKWIVVCMVMLLLVGCTRGNTAGSTQEKESWKMNEAMIQMIKDAVGCNERRAKAILETFREVQMSEPISACPADGDSGAIVVETKDGGKYEIGIDKKHYVFSITDLLTGEPLYMVIE